MVLRHVAAGFRVAVSACGVDSESGLIQSVDQAAANGHDLTPAAELLHGEETVVYADAG